MRAALEQALTENPVPSLAVVAKRLRLSKALLRAQFYDLCAALGERYRMGFRNNSGNRAAPSNKETPSATREVTQSPAL